MFNRESPSFVMRFIDIVLLAAVRSEQGSGWRTFPVKHSGCEHAGADSPSFMFCGAPPPHRS